MTVLGVQLFSIPVSDQDRARDFYLRVLGLELVEDRQMGPGRRWVQVRPVGGGTAITLVTWFESMPPGSSTGIVLETDDVEGELERLRALGVAVADGVQQAPWGRYLQVQDPDGNGLILQQSALGVGRSADAG